MKKITGKRYYKVNEPDFKETGNTDQLILEYLEENGLSPFGDLWHYVNSHLKEPYSRKGSDLYLKSMISRGKIARRSFKQGHYLYHLTKSGQEDISLKAKKFGDIFEDLLRIYIPKELDYNERNYLKRMVERTGFFMLFSCIEAFKSTSLNNTHKENVSILKEWIKEFNPSYHLFNYFSEILTSFLKYRSEDEALTPVFQSRKKMKKLLELEQKLARMFTQEYDVCTKTVTELPERIKKELETEGFLKRYREWIKRLDKKMKSKARNLKPNECPRCHYDGRGPVKSGPYKGDNFFRGYRDHAHDNTKWCDLCYFGISNPLVRD